MSSDRAEITQVLLSITAPLTELGLPVHLSWRQGEEVASKHSLIFIQHLLPLKTYLQGQGLHHFSQGPPGD